MYPMVLSMTCFSAPFDHPTEDSIGERFLRDPGKGAIAFFGASWMNWPDPVNSRAMIESLLTPGESIGDAILAVKHKATDPVFVQMYNLLGDPAVVLSLPRQTLQVDVEHGRWDTRVNVRIPAADFGGNVDVDWLDQNGDRLASARYEARDAQFSLAPPDKAVRVQVYVADTRNGLNAFGSADLTPPPPPVGQAQAETRAALRAAAARPPAPDTIRRERFRWRLRRPRLPSCSFATAAKWRSSRCCWPPRCAKQSAMRRNSSPPCHSRHPYGANRRPPRWKCCAACAWTCARWKIPSVRNTRSATSSLA